MGAGEAQVNNLGLGAPHPGVSVGLDARQDQYHAGQPLCCVRSWRPVKISEDRVVTMGPATAGGANHRNMPGKCAQGAMTAANPMATRNPYSVPRATDDPTR